MKKIALCALSLLLCVLMCSCSDKKEVPVVLPDNSDIRMCIMSNKSNVHLNDYEYSEILSSIETSVEKYCTPTAALSLILSDDSVDRYKTKGVFVSVEYTEPRDFSIGADIKKITVLTDTMKDSYIICLPDVGIGKVFPCNSELSKKLLKYMR